jgi:hypothetical protein
MNPLDMQPFATSVLASGFRIVMPTEQDPENVELVVTIATRCPVVPSNKSNPIPPIVAIVTSETFPSEILPEYATCAAEYPGGMTKKSELLTASPAGVWILNRPEAAAAGTVVEIDVRLADIVGARVAFNKTVLFAAVESKFVPVIVTAVDAAPIVGLKLVMVGGPVDAPVGPARSTAIMRFPR